MAFTAPRTWTTGELVTAAMLNSNVRDNMNQTAVALASTAGQIPYATGANALAMLAIGSANKVLTSTGTAPQWVTQLAAVGLTTQGDMLYADATPAAARLAIGSANAVMRSTGTAPAWTTNVTIDSSGRVAQTGTVASSTDNFSIQAPSTSTSLTADFATLALKNTGANTANSYVSIQFYGNNSTPTLTVHSGIYGVFANKTAGAEAGDVLIATRTGGGALVERWRFSAAGHMVAGADNAYDIGASGATRPRTGYFGTALAVGTNPASTGALRLPNNTGIYARNAANLADRQILILNSSDNVYVGDGTNQYVVANASVAFSPPSDNGISCGGNVLRWTAVWAVNGTIQTSHSDHKTLLGEIDTAEALSVARSHTYHRFTYKGDHGDEFLLHYRHVGIKAEEAHEWLSPDGKTVNPQTTASVALAAVAGEADAREADIAALREEIARLRAELTKRSN